MNADLERVIALQRLDSATHDAQRRLAEEPERLKAFDARLESARAAVAAAKERLTENQTARRAIEKEVAVHQGRLSKFRDQLMSVKTNVEYQAMQKEIEFAQTEVKTHEDRILERMLEADDLTAAVKRAEADFAAEQKSVEARSKGMRDRPGRRSRTVERNTAERAELVRALSAAGALDLRAGRQAAQRSGGRRSARRDLHDLPRPPAPSGVQLGPAQRRHPPVRPLQPNPVLRPGAGSSRADSLTPVDR